MAWGAACWTQSTLREATPSASAGAMMPWALLGSRQRVGATTAWASLLARYADGEADGHDVVHTVVHMHRLGHHDPAPVQLAIALLRTLPETTSIEQDRLLRHGARHYPDHAWFALGLSVGMARGELAGTPDEQANWLSVAAHLDPRLQAPRNSR